jgi:hypothetical protein
MECSGNETCNNNTRSYWKEVVGRRWNAELVIVASEVFMMRVNEKVHKTVNEATRR